MLEMGKKSTIIQEDKKILYLVQVNSKGYLGRDLLSYNPGFYSPSVFTTWLDRLSIFCSVSLSRKSALLYVLLLVRPPDIRIYVEEKAISGY